MYYWQGEVIKLNEKDYNKVKRAFPSLDLEMELLVVDAIFSNERPQNWYMAMMYKLRHQQDKANNQPNSTRHRTIEQDLTDRSWAGNVRAIK